MHDVALAAPTFDVPPQLRLRELLLERAVAPRRRRRASSPLRRASRRETPGPRGCSDETQGQAMAGGRSRISRVRPACVPFAARASGAEGDQRRVVVAAGRGARYEHFGVHEYRASVAHGFARLAPVRADPVHHDVGAARLVAPDAVTASSSRSHAVRLTASGSACCSRTPGDRADPASTSSATRPTPSARRYATASTSCRGTRAASARARRSVARATSTSSTRSNRNSTSAAAERERRRVEATRRRLPARQRRLLPYLSTRASVRDMDAIRAAMGVRPSTTSATRTARISVRSTPSATRTGCARWCWMARSTRRRRTTTGSSRRPRASSARSTRSWIGARRTTTAAFARRGNPKTAFADLMTTLAHESDPAKIDGEERSLSIGEANIGVATALYAGDREQGWVDAREGAEQTPRPATGRRCSRCRTPIRDATPAVATTTSRRRSTRSVASTDRRRVGRRRSSTSRSAPRVWRRTSVHQPCGWGCRARTGRFRPTGGPAPIHARGRAADPRSRHDQRPRDAVRAGAGPRRELDSGRLLTFVGQGHTAYGRGHACIDQAVDDYWSISSCRRRARAATSPVGVRRLLAPCSSPTPRKTKRSRHVARVARGASCRRRRPDARTRRVGRAPQVGHRLAARLFDAGYAGLHWPAEYGGRGASPTEQLIFYEETTQARAPYVGVNFVGTLHAGPTLIEEGTDAQKAEHLPKILPRCTPSRLRERTGRAGVEARESTDLQTTTGRRPCSPGFFDRIAEPSHRFLIVSPYVRHMTTSSEGRALARRRRLRTPRTAEETDDDRIRARIRRPLRSRDTARGQRRIWRDDGAPLGAGAQHGRRATSMRRRAVSPSTKARAPLRARPRPHP